MNDDAAFNLAILVLIVLIIWSIFSIANYSSYLKTINSELEKTNRILENETFIINNMDKNLITNTNEVKTIDNNFYQFAKQSLKVGDKK